MQNSLLLLAASTTCHEQPCSVQSLCTHYRLPSPAAILTSSASAVNAGLHPRNNSFFITKKDRIKVVV